MPVKGGEAFQNLSQKTNPKSKLDDLLSRRLIFVTGKGGVGKTTVATALAVLAAEKGKRVLLCEIVPKSEIVGLFGVPNGDFEATEVRDNLFVMEMNTEKALVEYIKLFLKIPIPITVGPLAKTFDFVSNAAPGVREILVVGKLCYEVRQNHYDIVIADSSASGHVISQLASPQGVNQLFGVGLVKDQTKWMLDILTDSTSTGICLVSTPEETPVEETLEVFRRINEETQVAVALGVVNKLIPKIFSALEEGFLNVVEQDGVSERLGKRVGPGMGGLVHASKLWQDIAGSHEKNARRLYDEFGGGVPMVEIPLMPGMKMGIGLVREIAETLEVELS